MSAKQYGQYGYCPGGDVSVLDGLDKLIGLLVDSLPDSNDWLLTTSMPDVGDHLRLSTEVTFIDWSANRVKVHTRNVLTGACDVVTADHVVVTTPLGFLKENYAELFKPQLPAAKIKAIKR